MNKRIAPTIILVIAAAYILLQGGVIIWALSREGLALIWKILIGSIPLIFVIALISVYMERMKEIDEGDENDVDKY